MAKLGVNIDHVATVRQARLTSEPNPVRAAAICETAGADGIVAHLREDRRHIQDKDVKLIKESIKIKFNLEMAPTREMVDKALDILPQQVTLVPEKRKELTTEGGLDVHSQIPELARTVEMLQGERITVSLFIDPEMKQIKAALETGAKAIEFHTGRYAEKYSMGEFKPELKKLIECVDFAKRKSLHVHAGHGLTYQNVQQIADIEGIEELNIGHTIIAKAVLIGLEKAVRDMIALVKK